MENKLSKQRPPRYEITNQYQMAKMATVLKEHIVKNNLSVKIVGKDYAMVEGWQFAGGLTGLFPMIIDTTELSKGNEIKWKSVCHIIRIKDDKQVGRGDAVCSNKETKKSCFDEYAILSMAQTRSIGKAYRNLLGWVMKLAGYEAIPAEEMKSEQPRTGIKLSVIDINKKIDQINNKDLLKKMTDWLEKHTTDYTETQMSVMRRRLEEVAKEIK